MRTQSIDRRGCVIVRLSLRAASGERTRHDHALGIARDLRDCEECATEAKVRTKSCSKATHATRRRDADMQVTTGRMQRDDGVMKYMLVMQFFQKAIDSKVPREYSVPVLSGG